MMGPSIEKTMKRMRLLDFNEAFKTLNELDAKESYFHLLFGLGSGAVRDLDLSTEWFTISDRLFFVNTVVKTVYYYQGAQWLVSENHSYEDWCKMIIILKDEKDSLQYAETVKANMPKTPEFGYEDMIKVMTKETWNLLTPEVQAKIITKLS